MTLFIALTLAHPAVLLNDEFISTNQFASLHEGHQVVVNEGKYGLLENGSMGGYFWYKSNVLGYTLFLPLISLPTHWIIDLSGEHFVYIVLCLWTLAALLIVLMVNHYFPKQSFIGKWQWTPWIFISIFIVFFINLIYYSVFPVDSFHNYPEIISIVFTNTILLAISGVLIYEINRTIFEDTAFSVFGTLVCLFSSSYFFWATYCKDHVLVLPIFIGVFLCLVRFLKTDEYWYLPLAFLMSGLLAWARPEIAIWIVFLIFGVCCYTVFRYLSVNRPEEYPLISVLCSPLFTFIGALPFFFNNYLLTKNPLVPTQTLYQAGFGVPLGVNASPSLNAVSVNSAQGLIMRFVPSIDTTPAGFVSDMGEFYFIPKTEVSAFLHLSPCSS